MEQKDFLTLYNKINQNDINELFALIRETIEGIKPTELGSLVSGKNRIKIDFKESSKDSFASKNIEAIARRVCDLMTTQNDSSESMKKSILELIQSEFTDEQFWEIIIEYAAQNAIPFFETRFLYKYDISQREHIYRAIIKDAILFTETEEVLINEVGINEFDVSNLNVVIKLINSLIIMATTKCMGYSRWILSAQKDLYLPIEDGKLIWGIIRDNRQELYIRSIMKIVHNMESEIDDIKELLDNRANTNDTNDAASEE